MSYWRTTHARIRSDIPEALQDSLFSDKNDTLLNSWPPKCLDEGFSRKTSRSSYLGTYSFKILSCHSR